MYTTIKVPRSVRDRLEGYARPRGLTLAGAIDRLLEENTILEELRGIRKLLEEQNRELRAIRSVLERDRGNRSGADVIAGKDEGSVSEEDSGDMPSFVSGNPWLKVLSGRGGG